MAFRRNEGRIRPRGRDAVVGLGDRGTRDMRIGGRQPTDEAKETNEEQENKNPAPGHGAQSR